MERSVDSQDGDKLLDGETCWRVEPAGRVAFVVDGAAYFEALAASIERAERSVLILGWDFHSRVRLRRGRGAEDERFEFARVLDRAVRLRRDLRVHVIGWDFAMIYAAEREFLPLLRFNAKTHRRVQFRLDGEHPIGGSQHQKVAVIDDRIAFCGGLDVTACRWDTPQHAAGDPRRSDPGFPSYNPFHDVQIAVDGAAAAALGDLARERWRRLTGRRLEPARVASDPWPPELQPDLRDVSVGIARTDPAHDGRPEVREVEALWVRALRAARRSIYLENQYLTSARVGDVLAERLREPDGPDVVIVGPASCSGWLEESTMGVLRARLLRRLRQADRHDRLRVYHPVVPHLETDAFNLHAKVLVVDDRLARVGSANCSNRSMGLDSECDLAIDARGDARVAEGIAAFRNRLLGEHLDARPEEVEDAIRAHGLGSAVEKLRGGERTLQPLEGEATETLAGMLPDFSILDPEKPVQVEELMKQVLPEEIADPGKRRVALRIAFGIAALGALALLWRATPLGEWVTPERLSALAVPLRETWTGSAVAAVALALLCLVMVPVTALIVSAGLVFGGLQGFGVALAGSLLGAAAGFGIGALLWRDAVRRLAGWRLGRLRGVLSRGGAFPMAAVRLIPIAPFTVVNLVAGAMHVRFRDFALGTLLGMAPGTFALCMLSESVWNAVVDPRPATLLAVVAVAAVTIGGGIALHRRLRSGSGIG